MTKTLVTEELQKYLIDQGRDWMLAEEIRALARTGLTPLGEKIEREVAKKNLKIEQFNGFSDSKTNDLVNLGKEKMLTTIAQRLLDRHGDEIVNKCPNCNKLARTPRAKQCRHCGHDWH